MTAPASIATAASAPVPSTVASSAVAPAVTGSTSVVARPISAVVSRSRRVVVGEAMAGAVTGLEVMRTAEPEKGPRWYDKAPLGIRMADGTGYPVRGDRHPDPTAEAIRRQICEDELVQAIGRARAVNRTAETPVQIEIWNDAVLPLTVDGVVQWGEVPAGREIEMAASGVVLESPSDMTACWPGVWSSEKAARQWRDRGARSQNPIENSLYKGLGPCSFRYQRQTVGAKWRRGLHLPDVVADPRAWLEARLGAVREFELVAA